MASMQNKLHSTIIQCHFYTQCFWVVKKYFTSRKLCKSWILTNGFQSGISDDWGKIQEIGKICDWHSLSHCVEWLLYAIHQHWEVPFPVDLQQFKGNTLPALVFVDDHTQIYSKKSQSG
jgi:hypothetical protein